MLAHFKQGKFVAPLHARYAEPGRRRPMTQSAARKAVENTTPIALTAIPRGLPDLLRGGAGRIGSTGAESGTGWSRNSRWRRGGA